jgi:Flp pilus assembly protein TadD
VIFSRRRSPRARAAVPVLAVFALLGLAACQSGPGDAPASAKTHGEVAMTLAQAAESAGDYPAAVRMYEQAIVAGKGGRQAYERRAETLWRMGLPAEAAQAYAEAIRAGHADPSLRLGHGRALLALGDGASALAEYQAVLADSPGNVRAMNGRGVALDMLQRHDEAQAQYRAVLAVAPADLAAHNNLALSYTLSGRIDEAIAMLERLQAAGLAAVRHRQNLALLYGLTGQVERAEALARQDLGAEAAARNLAIYADLRHLLDAQRDAVAPPAAAAAVLEAPAAQAPAAQAPAAQAPAAQSAPSPGTEPARRRQPWVLELGRFESADTAKDAWRRLKLDGIPGAERLVHYVENDEGASRLVAGPVWDDADVARLCDAIRKAALSCEAHPASAAGPRRTDTR